jgi:hypothetical protein
MLLQQHDGTRIGKVRKLWPFSERARSSIDEIQQNIASSPMHPSLRKVRHEGTDWPNQKGCLPKSESGSYGSDVLTLGSRVLWSPAPPLCESSFRRPLTLFINMVRSQRSRYYRRRQRVPTGISWVSTQGVIPASLPLLRFRHR